MMATKTFTRQQMQDVLWEGYGTILVNDMVDKSRWSIMHVLVFELDGELYRTYYQKGATEYQDEVPFEYDDEVQCDIVESYEKTVTEYRLKLKEQDT
jgi:hypothetical protein